MMLPDGISFDFPKSTIVIDGVRFPAVVLTYTDDNCQRDRCDGCEFFAIEQHCVNGGGTEGWDSSWAIYIPAESGVLFEVEYQHSTDWLSLHLYSPALRKHPARMVSPGDPSRGPQTMMVDGRRIVRWRAVASGPWYWEPCEVDWLAEQITRLSTYEVDRLTGARARLLPISDLRVRPKGTVLL